MDSRFVASRDDLYNVQMDVKQLQVAQHNHSERLLRVEKRLAEDAALKSVWGGSPFPSALGGTPQHGPVQISTNDDVFEEFEEHGHSLLGSLRLETEDEPVRRGAASRANSVRFDESALQGANWNQAARHSAEFVPIRPSSGFGMMERSLSHKSDGRHSSAGHSVHSVHSAASGRGSSLGLDTHFMVGAREDDSPLDIPGPPPNFFVLGSVPAIVRCWLTDDFAHNTLLYADVCSGAQRSTMEFSLAKELGMVGDIHKSVDGVNRLALTVYLAEAIVSQSNSRSPAPAPQIPSMTVNFEIVGTDLSDTSEAKKAIRIFLGTDALRAHSADLLFSQNLMTLYSSDRDKLSVPFVRPEDDSLFRFLATTNIVPERPKLNASAPEFVLGDSKPASTTASQAGSKDTSSKEDPAGDMEPSEEEISRREVKESQSDMQSKRPLSPVFMVAENDAAKPNHSSSQSESGAQSDKLAKEGAVSGDGDGNNLISESTGSKENAVSTPTASESGRRDLSGIWGSWRQTASANGTEGGLRSENGLSGYQPAGRRGMKVLKPAKSSTANAARQGPASSPGETPAPQRSSGEHRRKSQGGSGGISAAVNGPPPATASPASVLGRWEKRHVSSSAVAGTTSGREVKGQVPPPPTTETRTSSTVPRSANPIGGASAFSWMMTSSSKNKTSTAVGE